MPRAARSDDAVPIPCNTAMNVTTLNPSLMLQIDEYQDLDPVRVVLLDRARVWSDSSSCISAKTGGGAAIIQCQLKAWCADWYRFPEGHTCRSYMQDADPNEIAATFLQGRPNTRHESAHMTRIVRAVQAALKEHQ